MTSQQTLFTDNNSLPDKNLPTNWPLCSQPANLYVFFAYFCKTNFFLPNHTRENLGLNELFHIDSLFVFFNRHLLLIYFPYFLILLLSGLKDFSSLDNLYQR